MKCINCGVNVNTPSKYCPVCSNKLKSKCTNTIYPKIKRKFNFGLRLLVLVSLIVCLICGYINYELDKSFTWSIYVFLGVMTNCITVIYIFRSYKDIFKLLGRYGMLLMILLIIWYIFTKSKYIVNLVIPILCIVELLFNDVVTFIIKRKHIKKYLGILIANVVLSFVPMILIFFHIIDFYYVAHAALLLSVINILILVLFDFSDLKEELLMIFNY